MRRSTSAFRPLVALALSAVLLGALAVPGDVHAAEAAPSLTFSTYLGGDGGEAFADVATDSGGNIYVAGYTGSNVTMTDPLSPPELTSTSSSSSDVIVAKITPGGELAYLTTFGGNGLDFATAIEVDGQGRATVAGITSSTDLPVANAMFDQNQGGCPGEDSDCAFDGFFTRLDANGDIQTSTYFGGARFDAVADIVFDHRERLRFSLVTTSKQLQTSPLAVQKKGSRGASSDVYVGMLNPALTKLRSATYLRGEAEELPGNMALGRRGSIYVTGATSSSRFPTADPDATDPKGLDMFISRLSLGGRLLRSRTFGGTGYDSGVDVVFDRLRDRLFVTGVTQSADFPAKLSADVSKGKGTDGFIARLHPGRLRLSSARFIGGSGEDGAYGAALGPGGRLLLTGETDSRNFPTKAPVQAPPDPVTECAPDAKECANSFVTSVGARRLRLRYSTLLGGSGFDAGYGLARYGRRTHVVGTTESSDFPLVDPIQDVLVGGSDGFVSTIRD